MKIAGETYDAQGKIIPVYECHNCGKRSKFMEVIDNCEFSHEQEIEEHHKEEAEAGIL